MVHTRCSICQNTWKNEKVKFFCVPKDEMRRNRWIDSCGMNLQLNSTVCEKHFLNSDFINPPGDPDAKRVRLLPGAVPTVFSIASAKRIRAVPELPPKVKSVPDDWRLWCRLCAKDDQGNKNVLIKEEKQEGEQENTNEELNWTASIEKYFSINIKHDDDLPVVLCTECSTLITSMLNFSNRVSKVQEMYSCLLDCPVRTNLELQAVRVKYGFLDEDREDENRRQHSPETFYFEVEPTITLEEDRIHESNETSKNPLEQQVVRIDIDDENNEEKESNKMDGEDPFNSDFDEDDFSETNFTEAMINGEDAEQDEDGDDTTKSLTNGQTGSSNVDEDESDIAKGKGRKRQRKDSDNDEDDEDKFVFHCTECPRKFQHSYYLRRHMKVNHANIESLLELPCPKCSRICSTEEELDKHIKIHQSLDLRKDQNCPYCDKKFTSDSLRTHIKYVHMNVRTVICEECGVAVHTNGSLKKHMLTHTNHAPFKCNVCHKGFKDNERLKTHLETHDPRKHVCAECGLQLNSRATLYKHLLVHSDEKKHKCDYCGRAFKHSKVLKSHLIIHTGLKPYSCNFCELTFSNANNCRTHKRRLHPKELAALEAAGGKAYQQNIPKLEELKALTKVAGNLAPVGKNPTARLLRDPNNLTCPTCGLLLKSRSTYYQHLAVHSDIKKHKCDYCGRGFKHSKALKSHLIIHTGLKPFVCNFCGRSFADGSTCRGHKKRLHPVELAEFEAAGGETHTPNIPKLKDLKAITKAAINMKPVSSKQSRKAPDLQLQLKLDGFDDLDSIKSEEDSRFDELSN